MPGSLQLPSGLGFDPSPQFWVDQLEPGGVRTLAVIGPVLSAQFAGPLPSMAWRRAFDIPAAFG